MPHYSAHKICQENATQKKQTKWANPIKLTAKTQYLNVKGPSKQRKMQSDKNLNYTIILFLK